MVGDNAHGVNFTQTTSTRLDWGWTAAWQINVGLWPGVGAGTKDTTSQHGKRREIRGKKIKYAESTCSRRTGARVDTWLLAAWRLKREVTSCTVHIK